MILPPNLLNSNETPEGLQELMLYWVAQGWSVFPLNGKIPLTENGVKDATTDEHTIALWAKKWPDANVGGSTAGRLVIDIDTRKGAKWPKDLPSTRRHFSGRGDGGGHLIFALSLKQQAEGLKSGTDKLGVGLDVKTGANSYIVLPGSVHPDTGGKYTADGTRITFAPDELITEIKSSTTGSGTDDNGVRSLLTQLLANPPQEGSRNEWLTRVCGHYAKMLRKQPDIYFQLVSDANDKLPEPLDPEEWRKTADSIWNTESSGHPERTLIDSLKEESGFLISGDYSLITAGLEGPKDATEAVAIEYADFDLKLQGKIRNPVDDSLVYDLRLLRKRDRSELSIDLSGAEFGDPRKLKSRLASYGVSVAGSERLVHRTPDWSTRLLRYVDSQVAPEMTMAPYLGWNPDEGGYLTAEGVITADGPKQYTAVRPDPKLKRTGAATQRYGTAGDIATATDVLQRVCTYHDEETVAMFGAWWAANWAKHIIRRHVTMFPVMAIEAASGAGKTTGFFSMMVDLSGSTTGEGHFTYPTLRNALSANYNGIVWVDDLDDPTTVHEMIRVLTANGILSKMDSMGESTLQFQLVGSLVLSGESLEIKDQKALVERCVILEPGMPTGRKSRMPGREGKSQWIDVLELQDELRQHGGGHELAGHYASAVLGATEAIDGACGELREKVPSGREGERHLALLVGARILDYLLNSDSDPATIAKIWAGEGEQSKRVSELLAPKAKMDLSDTDNFNRFDELHQSMFVGDNALTMKIIPAALAAHSRSDDQYRNTPVFQEGDPDGDDYVIWFNTAKLAKWWSDENNGRISVRTESKNGLQAQSNQIRGEDGNPLPSVIKRTSRTNDRLKFRYRPIEGDLAKIIRMRMLG